MLRPRPTQQTDQPQPASATGRPILIEAIAITTQALEQRTRIYRNLVVAVSMTGMASIAAALVWWTPWPMLGVGLCVPLIAAYVQLDARLLARWRRSIRGLQDLEQLDATLLRNTMTQLKHLPQRSVQSMLDELGRD